MYNAIRFNVDLSAYPTLCRIYEYANTQPAFIAAMPKIKKMLLNDWLIKNPIKKPVKHWLLMV